FGFQTVHFNNTREKYSRMNILTRFSSVSPIIERQVQLEHVDAGLPKNSELPAFSVFPHKPPDLLDSHAAFARNSRNLKLSRCRTYMRVEPGRRSRNQIKRNRRIGILFAQRICRRLYVGLEELLACRPGLGVSSRGG